MVKVANIQHLATPVIAQLAEPRSAVELAGLLHPTPAVGGEPARARRPPRSPSSSRWTAAGTPARSAGWTRPRTASSASRLRSALLRDREAHLFAGVGVVADSDPAAELDETEVKLQALLPLVAELAREGSR